MKKVRFFEQLSASCKYDYKLKVISTWILTKKCSKPVLRLRHSLCHMLQNGGLVPTNQTWEHSLLLAALNQNLLSYICNLNDNRLHNVKFWGDKMMPDDPIL